MLDLHAKIRLSVAGFLVIAIAWFLPEVILAPASIPHARAVGLLAPPAPPEAADTGPSCPQGTATVEQCAASASAASTAEHPAEPSATRVAEPVLAHAEVPSEAAPESADGEAGKPERNAEVAVLPRSDGAAESAKSVVVATTAAPATTALHAPSRPGANAVVPRGWAVQVGSFAARGTALRRVDELVSQGVPAYVSTSRVSRHKVLYRVRAPAPDRDSALDLALKLRLAGFEVSLAKPPP